MLVKSSVEILHPSPLSLLKIFLRSSDLLLQISPNLLSKSTSLRPPTRGRDAGAASSSWRWRADPPGDELLPPGDGNNGHGTLSS